MQRGRILQSFWECGIGGEKNWIEIFGGTVWERPRLDTRRRLARHWKKKKNEITNKKVLNHDLSNNRGNTSLFYKFRTWNELKVNKEFSMCSHYFKRTKESCFKSRLQNGKQGLVTLKGLNLTLRGKWWNKVYYAVPFITGLATKRSLFESSACPSM